MVGVCLRQIGGVDPTDQIRWTVVSFELASVMLLTGLTACHYSSRSRLQYHSTFNY